MQGRIYHELRPVLRRQQGLHLLRSAAWGLLVSAVAGISLGAWRRLTGSEVASTFGALILIVGPVLGLLIACVRRRSWHLAAAAVDTHYQLKDRTVTAL